MSAIVCPIIAKLARRLRREANQDEVIDSLITKMSARADLGFAKYRQTLARKDVSESGWQQHALDEALDLIAYLEAYQYHHGDNETYSQMQTSVLVIASILESDLQH
jgi:hypothetical protein